MKWTQTFYQKQYELLARGEAWPKVWESMTLSSQPPRVRLIERSTDARPKRILEWGCGSGVVAGTMAAVCHSVVAVDLAPIAATHARQIGEIGGIVINATPISGQQIGWVYEQQKQNLQGEIEHAWKPFGLIE